MMDTFSPSPLTQCLNHNGPFVKKTLRVNKASTLTNTDTTIRRFTIEIAFGPFVKKKH